MSTTKNLNNSINILNCTVLSARTATQTTRSTVHCAHNKHLLKPRRKGRGLGGGVVIGCCRDMAAFLKNNRPVHPIVHHWFIIFHFQLGSNPSHCRPEMYHRHSQNIRLFTPPIGNGSSPRPKHPPLCTTDWKWIIARAKTSTSCPPVLLLSRMDPCRSVTQAPVLLLHSVPGGPLVRPQVFQSLVCALYMYGTSTCPPGTKQYCPLSTFHSSPPPPSRPEWFSQTGETSSPFTVSHTTQTQSLKNKCCPSTAFYNRPLSLSHSPQTRSTSVKLLYCTLNRLAPFQTRAASPPPVS